MTRRADAAIAHFHHPCAEGIHTQLDLKVWNPLAGAYEPLDSLDGGLFRLAELVEQVRVMWVQQDPAREYLKEAPDPAEDGDSEWAELRVSTQSNLVYEPRNFDQPG